MFKKVVEFKLNERFGLSGKESYLRGVSRYLQK